MLEGLDSATEPSAAAAMAAKAAGYGIWSGYLGTTPNTGVRSWSQGGFENARLCGNMPLAYCSGYDDPAGIRNLAVAWNVRLTLDCENGIRGLHDPDASWIQPFLDVSGAGLYGGAQIHQMGFRAPFYVLGAYPTSGDPTDASWNSGPAPRPNAPCGWQWAGSHGAFGVTVDSSTFDDWFRTGGGFMALTDAQQQEMYDMLCNYGGGQHSLFTGGPVTIGSMVSEMHQALAGLPNGAPDGWITQQIQAMQTKLDALSGGGVDVNALAAALIPHLPPGTDPQVVATAVADKLAQRLVS